MASVLALFEAYNRKGAAGLGFFPCVAAPYTRDILLIVPQAGLLQIPLPGVHAEVGLQLVHLVVGNGMSNVFFTSSERSAGVIAFRLSR